MCYFLCIFQIQIFCMQLCMGRNRKFRWDSTRPRCFCGAPITISASRALVCCAPKKESRREENYLHHLESRGCFPLRYWCTQLPVPKLRFRSCVLYSLFLGDFLFPPSGDFKQVAYQRNKLYRCFPRSRKVPENDDTVIVLHELVNVW